MRSQHLQNGELSVFYLIISVYMVSIFQLIYFCIFTLFQHLQCSVGIYLNIPFELPSMVRFHDFHVFKSSPFMICFNLENTQKSHNDKMVVNTICYVSILKFCCVTGDVLCPAHKANFPKNSTYRAQYKGSSQWPGL